jgi:hypothetical protein
MALSRAARLRLLEKSSEGIRKFPSDIGKLEKFVARKIN